MFPWSDSNIDPKSNCSAKYSYKTAACIEFLDIGVEQGGHFFAAIMPCCTLDDDKYPKLYDDGTSLVSAISSKHHCCTCLIKQSPLTQVETSPRRGQQPPRIFFSPEDATTPSQYKQTSTMAAEKVLCIADLQKAASQILPVATRGNEPFTQDIVLNG